VASFRPAEVKNNDAGLRARAYQKSRIGLPRGRRNSGTEILSRRRSEISWRTPFGLLPVHAKEPVIRGGLKLGRAAMQNGSVSLLVLRCRRFRAGIGTAFRIQYGKVDAIGWVFASFA
jgi:hypothetical protein